MDRICRCIGLILTLSILLTIGAVPAYAAETEEDPAVEETMETLPAETEEELYTEETAEAALPPETTVMETEPTEAETFPQEEPTEPEEDEIYSQSDSMSFANDWETGGIPLIWQTDYASTPYSDGTVATSGCTMTCIAMVATAMTGEAVWPDDLAGRFNYYDASNIQRMEAVSTVLDLEYTKTFSWGDVLGALDQGKPVIILLGKESPFTASQHTVVLTGITPEGKILVNDPYGPNYKKPELKDGFLHGFSQETVTAGFSGAWIYEDYVPLVSGNSRYPEITLTQEEMDLMAGIIWLEARGEPFEGQQAIAEIILNRLVSGQFSTTVTGVILAEGQFRTAKFLDEAKPGELQYKAIEKALLGPNVLPTDVCFFGRSAANDNVWGTIGGHTFCRNP